MTASPAPPAAAPAAGGRTLPHPATADIRLEDVLRALSDPARLTVVRTLAGAADAIACSGVSLPVSKSTRTHHFRVLRESGVIRQTYRGTAKMTALRRADLDRLFPGLLDRVLAASEAQAGRLGEDRGRGSRQAQAQARRQSAR
jgi:DNA-binding transcriptional ArsR family regulator